MAVATFAAGTAVEPYPAGSVLDAQCDTVWQNVTHDGAVLHAECAPHETPVAGELCPAWVHDQYMTTGPDGAQYRTWHPIVDETYGCGFDHEHGSDPRLFGDGTWLPAFGYVGNAAHHSEGHAGYKLIAFTKDVPLPGGITGRFDFMYALHAGSSGLARACVRYHEANVLAANDTLDTYEYDWLNPETEQVEHIVIGPHQLVADARALFDFGEADIVADGVTTSIPLATCENADIHNPRGYEVDADGEISFPGVGERHLPLYETKVDAKTGEIKDVTVGYEPWVVNYRPYEPYGLMLRGLSVNTHSSVTACIDRACSSVVDRNNPTHQHGAFRSVVYTSNDTSRLGFHSLPAVHGPDGVFYTNEFLDGPGTIRQFIMHGLELEFYDAGRMYAQSPENGWYARGQPEDFGRPQFNPLRLLNLNGPSN